MHLHLFSSTCNTSQLHYCTPGIRYETHVLITKDQMYIITLINYVFLCGSISLFGAVANVINVTVFLKQGLNSTINISFFALAISDFSSLTFQQLSNVYVNPLFARLDLPMVYSEVQFLTVRLARVLFTRVTFFITVYITAERCLCIAYPLHIKQIITPRRTVVILVCIYCLITATFLPVFSTIYLDWKFHPRRNRTVLGIAYRKHKDFAIATTYFFQAISGVLAFIAVVILTLILIYKLGQKNNWRKCTNLQTEKMESMSHRNRATVKMVVLIASILIICYIPSVCLCLITFIEPEFTEGGKLYSIYASFWSVAMVLETINSSVNIFFYFQMSTKYRQTFKELFIEYLCNTNTHGTVGQGK